MDWANWQAWISELEWSRLIPELVGKGLGFMLGFAASWYFLFRKRIRELQRFQQGDSDDILFQCITSCLRLASKCNWYFATLLPN